MQYFLWPVGPSRFPRGLMYIYIFVSLARLCVVYVVKEVASFRGLGQLMGVARKENARLSYRAAGC